MQRLSIRETELRLVQRDMIRALNLPAVADPPPSERQSFKKRSGPAPSVQNTFPTLPLDRVCTDRMDAVMQAGKWRAHASRTEAYYRFPQGDFDKYFATPVLPDSASDKLTADRGATSSKRPFADKARGKLEEVAKKLDSASRFGMRSTSFLLLLSEYLALGADGDSAVPADLVVAALHCLDDGLRTILDQFSRISALATSSRRANVLDALFLPSVGARKRLDALPLTGPDLFAGQFQESMEAEAKRIKAADKINLKKPAAPKAKAKKQASFLYHTTASTSAARPWWVSRQGRHSI